MSDHLWRLAHLTMNGNERPRLHDITLTIHRGITAIVGYSGAGKTSLLNLLAGMESADAGTIEFCHPASAAEQSLPLFWVPQDGGLWPHMTAYDHIAAVSETFGTDGNSSDQVDNLLQNFDLLQCRDALPCHMSKGEQSRLSVARCLAARAAVMLMDEPLAHVDPVRRTHYWKLIRDKCRNRDVSLVFSTHEPEAAIRESNNIVCLSDGKIIFSGLTTELYNQPPDAVAGEFLGPVNWFSKAEAEIWLNSELQEIVPCGFRPEAICLEQSESDSPHVVSFHFFGSYAETVLCHQPSAQQKTIFHRPMSQQIAAGQHVTIKVQP